MHIFDKPKIDCHNHVFDPARFPYAPDAYYAPSGQEIGTGLVKCSREPYPYPDAWPYVRALIDSFGFDALLWGSDWPFRRAPERIDYGPLLSTLVELLVPDPADRRTLLWDAPGACSASTPGRQFSWRVAGSLR